MTPSFNTECISKKDLRLLSYADFGQLLEALTENVRIFCRDHDIQIDVVAPILRSGAFPGCHLASKLGLLDVLPLQYKHTYDTASPIHRHLRVPTLSRDLPDRPWVLIADTNTVTGEIAQYAAADIRQIWPHSRILFASVALDISLESMPEIDHLISARRTNERRSLSRAAAARVGVSHDLFVFPWESIEEQWAEIQAAQSVIGTEEGPENLP